MYVWMAVSHGISCYACSQEKKRSLQTLFYDSIGVVPMDWIMKKTTADGSVDDKMVTVQWRDGNKRIPYDTVILFKGTACRKLSFSSYLKKHGIVC